MTEILAFARDKLAAVKDFLASLASLPRGARIAFAVAIGLIVLLAIVALA